MTLSHKNDRIKTENFHAIAWWWHREGSFCLRLSQPRGCCCALDSHITSCAHLKSHATQDKCNESPVNEKRQAQALHWTVCSCVSNWTGMLSIDLLLLRHGWKSAFATVNTTSSVCTTPCISRSTLKVHMLILMTSTCSLSSGSCRVSNQWSFKWRWFELCQRAIVPYLYLDSFTLDSNVEIIV